MQGVAVQALFKVLVLRRFNAAVVGFCCGYVLMPNSSLQFYGATFLGEAKDILRILAA